MEILLDFLLDFRPFSVYLLSKTSITFFFQSVNWQFWFMHSMISLVRFIYLFSAVFYPVSHFYDTRTRWTTMRLTRTLTWGYIIPFLHSPPLRAPPVLYHWCEILRKYLHSFLVNGLELLVQLLIFVFVAPEVWSSIWYN